MYLLWIELFVVIIVAKLWADAKDFARILKCSCARDTDMNSSEFQLVSNAIATRIVTWNSVKTNLNVLQTTASNVNKVTGHLLTFYILEAVVGYSTVLNGVLDKHEYLMLWMTQFTNIIVFFGMDLVMFYLAADVPYQVIYYHIIIKLPIPDGCFDNVLSESRFHI